MTDGKQLRDGAAAVIRNQIHLGDSESIEQRHEHQHLRIGADVLVPCNTRVAHAEKIRGDAPRERCKPLDGPAPLKAIQWKPVQQQHRTAFASCDIRHLTKGRARVFSRRCELRLIECFDQRWPAAADGACFQRLNG